MRFKGKTETSFCVFIELKNKSENHETLSPTKQILIMKTFYFIFLLTFLSSMSFAQSLDCKKMQVGKFELVSKTSGTTIIERTKNTQTETNETMQIKTSYDLVWINECSYELRNRKVVEGNSKFVMKPTDVVTVEIIKIEGTKLTVKITSNFSDKVAEVEIEKK